MSWKAVYPNFQSFPVLKKDGKKVGREKEAERIRTIVRGSYNANETKKRGRQGV